jgi:hypothetical protein
MRFSIRERRIDRSLTNTNGRSWLGKSLRSIGWQYSEARFYRC